MRATGKAGEGYRRVMCGVQPFGVSEAARHPVRSHYGGNPDQRLRFGCRAAVRLHLYDARGQLPDHFGPQGQPSGATHMAVVKVTPGMLAKTIDEPTGERSTPRPMRMSLECGRRPGCGADPDRRRDRRGDHPNGAGAPKALAGRIRGTVSFARRDATRLGAKSPATGRPGARLSPRHRPRTRHGSQGAGAHWRSRLPSVLGGEGLTIQPAQPGDAVSNRGHGRHVAQPSFLPRIEIAQVRRRLILAGRHQAGTPR